MKALNWEPGNEELERCLKRAKDAQCESYWDKLVVEHNVCFHMDACCHAMVNVFYYKFLYPWQPLSHSLPERAVAVNKY